MKKTSSAGKASKKNVGGSGRRAFTDRQLIRQIRLRTREQGYPPSIRELADDLGVGSSETIHGALVRLRDENKVTWVAQQPRTLKVVRGVR